MRLDQMTYRTKVSARRKRVGRGNAGDAGTTAGRGSKGQRARAGGRLHPRFEGGQTPFSQRIPKQRGFKRKEKVIFKIINLNQLYRFAEEGKVTIERLRKRSFLKRSRERVKLLGEGEIKEPVSVEAHAASQSAIKKIEAAGGKVVIVS